MGPGQNFFTQVESGQFFVVQFGLGRVSHLWFGFEFGKFPLKMSNFSTFVLQGKKDLFGSCQKVSGSKARLASCLLQIKSKLGLGRITAHL